jgi:hypothetical protein
LAKASQASPAPAESTLAELKDAVEKQTKAAEKAKSALDDLAAARHRAETLAALIAGNIEAIQTAARAPYPTPRTQTTDVALAKLEESRKSLDELRSLAQDSAP